MAQPKTPPPLLPFNADSIPQELKDLPRWAPWKAVWKEKRGKYDKVPYRADAINYGLSTNKPERWFPFDVALAAYRAHPGAFNGLGLVMTGYMDLVGTDLDGCVKNGAIEPWAQKIVDDLGSYAEISPSGRGLRVFNLGAQEEDWTNNEIGIEVYGGNDARFLTVSGQRLPSAPAEVRPAPLEVLAAMQKQYAKEKTKATVIDLNMPDLLGELSLPDLADLNLPYRVTDFLRDGTAIGDRSGLLHAAGIALYSAGLDDATVFSILANNEYAMEVALDHRRQDPDRAAMFIWREQCVKAKPKAKARCASIDELDDVVDVVDKKDVNSTHPPEASKKLRFAFQQAADYLKRKPVKWLVKKVLPHGEIGAIFGESTAGKSFFAIDLVMSVARGVEWNGHKVNQANVAYVVAEGASGFVGRLTAYAAHHSINLKDVPFAVLGDTPSFLEKQDVKDVLAGLKQWPDLKIVVIDTLAQVTAGANENSAEDMGRALAHAKAVARATGALVLLVAHSGKDANKGLRGWSGIKAALDVEILVERDTAGKRKAIVTKMKDGEGESTEFLFELNTVVIGHDDDNEPLTSCVLLHKGTQARTVSRRKLGDVEQKVFDIVVGAGDLASFTFDQLADAYAARYTTPTNARKSVRASGVRAIKGAQNAGYLSEGIGDTEIKPL